MPRVLITGSSSGIGLACARRLHETGWQVVGASRRAVPEVPWPHVTMDVDDDGSTAAGATRVLDDGPLDAVVTCAGWGLAGPVETTSAEDARAQFETNFWGTDRVVRAILPSLRERRSGRLVLVGSLAGIIPIPFQAYYSATKFALEGWAGALALEVAPFGIHVTVVEPGNVNTGFTDARQTTVSDDDPYRDAALRAITKMEGDERSGVDPVDVARTIEKVLSRRHPPRRVSVGRWGERVGVPAKRLLPQRVFERAAGPSLGV
ncbi:MAG: SDR family oxidoreductase [Nitriliruptorales bacterium]|nr:SDR family oxidoreductase [Nitriliruptorales bacterium]